MSEPIMSLAQVRKAKGAAPFLSVTTTDALCAAVEALYGALRELHDQLVSIPFPGPLL